MLLLIVFMLLTGTSHSKRLLQQAENDSAIMTESPTVAAATLEPTESPTLVMTESPTVAAAAMEPTGSPTGAAATMEPTVLTGTAEPTKDPTNAAGVMTESPTVAAAVTMEPTEAHDICTNECQAAYIANGGCADCQYDSSLCQVADFSPWPACSHCVLNEMDICPWNTWEFIHNDEDKEAQFELTEYETCGADWSTGWPYAYECYDNTVSNETSVSWPNWPLEEGKDIGDCQNSYIHQFNPQQYAPYAKVHCIVPGLIGIQTFDDAECETYGSQYWHELRFDVCDQDDYVGYPGCFRLKWSGYCAPEYVEVIAPPTENPTSGPSAGPSMDPTGSPSAVPTFGPSASPTVVPTFGPSATPSVQPSTSPSVVPSAGPSASPTVVPTFGPSMTPSMNPTSRPSVSPSAVPSVSPTAVPTFGPTTSPTVQPSINPTMAPTRTSQHREVEFLNNFESMVGSETEEFLASCTQQIHNQFVESTTSCVHAWPLAFNKMIIRLHDHCGDECASLDSDAEYLAEYGLNVPGFGHLYTEDTGTPSPTFAPTEATREPTTQPTVEPTTMVPTVATLEPTNASAEPTASAEHDLADEDLEESSASGLFSVFSMSLIVLALL